MRFLVLLRGINVGGKNKLPMADLRKIVSDAGFDNVVTYIQSGNVIFDAPRQAPGKIEKALERVLKKKGFDVKTLVLTLSNLEAVVKKAPALFGKDKKTHLCDVIFLLPPLTPSQALKSLVVRDGVDTVHAGPKVVFSSRVKALASRSGLSRVTQTPAYQNMTIRNWNTTKKLLELLKA